VNWSEDAWDKAKCKHETSLWKDAEEKAKFFFPEWKEREKKQRVVEFCSDCPIKGMCRDFAIENNEEHGMWGGVHAHEFSEIRRKRNYKPKKFAPHGSVERARQHLRAGEKLCQNCADAWNKHCWWEKQKAKR